MTNFCFELKSWKYSNLLFFFILIFSINNFVFALDQALPPLLIKIPNDLPLLHSPLGSDGKIIKLSDEFQVIETKGIIRSDDEMNDEMEVPIRLIDNLIKSFFKYRSEKNCAGIISLFDKKSQIQMSACQNYVKNQTNKNSKIYIKAIFEIFDGMIVFWKNDLLSKQLENFYIKRESSNYYLHNLNIKDNYLYWQLVVYFNANAMPHSKPQVLGTELKKISGQLKLNIKIKQDNKLFIFYNPSSLAYISSVSDNNLNKYDDPYPLSDENPTLGEITVSLPTDEWKKINIISNVINVFESNYLVGKMTSYHEKYSYKLTIP